MSGWITWITGDNNVDLASAQRVIQVPPFVCATWAFQRYIISHLTPHLPPPTPPSTSHPPTSHLPPPITHTLQELVAERDELRSGSGAEKLLLEEQRRRIQALEETGLLFQFTQKQNRKTLT